MWNILAFTVLYICVVEAQSQTGYCDYVQSRVCYNDPTDPVCATNGKTYRTRCDYAKAYCSDKTIHLKSIGVCPSTTSRATTTPSTAGKPQTQSTSRKPLNSSDAVLDIFCLDLVYIQCPVGGTPVCGSDGKLYDNACKFYKQVCNHRELRSRNSGC